MLTTLSKRIFTSGLAFFFIFNCSAQVSSVQHINKLPEGTKLAIRKDTTLIRFAVSFTETTRGNGTNDIPLNKIYNLNASEVSIGEQSITLNKSGLYHFDYYIQVISYSSDKIPVFTTFLYGVFPNSSITFIKDIEIPLTQDARVYKGNWNFSVDVHINAPATLKLNRYIIGADGASSVEGKFLGHLIKE